MLNTLLVANIGIHAVEGGKSGLFRRHVQTGMSHQRQQPRRFQRHGLAPGVGPGNQHHRLRSAQTHADRHHVARQKGMPRRRERQTAFGNRAAGVSCVDALGRIRRAGNRRLNGLQGYGLPPFGHCQVQPGQQVQQQQQVLPGHAHPGRQLTEDTLLLAFFCPAHFPPAVAQFNGRHGLDEHSCAAVGNVVDNARCLGPHVGFNQQNQPAVALGDDRLLDHLLRLKPPEAPLHGLVQPLVSGPGCLPQVSQRRAGVVQNFSGYTDGRENLPSQVSQVR